MFTIYGYLLDLVSRSIDEDIFTLHRDKMKVNLVTVGASKDSNTGLMSIIISCPVKEPLHSWVLNPTLKRLEEQLGLPMRQWNIGHCSIQDHVKLGIRFGEGQ